MRSESVLHNVADILLFVATPAPLAFLVLYARTRWWSTLAGRALMMKAGANASVLLLAASAALLGPGYPGREWLRVAVYGVLVVALWYLLAALVRYQFFPHTTEVRIMASKATGAHVAPATTQQAYPWRAALRTAVQALLAAPPALLALVLVIDTVTGDQFASYLPDGWVAWLGGASLFLAALAGLLARVTAIPAVDRWLRSVGLSSSPTPGAPAVEPPAVDTP